MMTTGNVVNGISSFHDQISNEIPKILDPWTFDVKIYRLNPLVQKLIGGGGAGDILYTVNLSYEQYNTVSIIGKQCTIFNTQGNKALVSSGSSSGHCDGIDQILQNKLNSTWVLKQSLKGEGGNSYELENEDGELFVVRTANCLLHGGFKGFLVEITYKGEGKGEEKIKSLIEKLQFPQGKLSFGKLNVDKSNYLGDLVYQYTQALQF